MTKYPVAATEVAFLKTTDEPVYVLNLTETTAVVRRAVQSDSGIHHNIELFNIDELQSKKQKLYTEMEDLKHEMNVRKQYHDEHQKSEQKSAQVPLPFDVDMSGGNLPN